MFTWVRAEKGRTIRGGTMLARTGGKGIGQDKMSRKTAQTGRKKDKQDKDAFQDLWDRKTSMQRIPGR